MHSSYGYDYGYRRGRRAEHGSRHRYGRPLGYDRELAPPGGRYFAPLPGERGYPAARWGWNPINWMMWPDPNAAGYDIEEFYERPRRRPEQSPTYGRGGDRAARRWSRRYGYEMEGAIRPRDPFPRQEHP